jgi:SAM-dependent methyltransferase
MAGLLVQRARELARSLVPSPHRAQLRSAVRRVAHFGLGFYCPLCNSRLRNWLPFGMDLPVLTRAGVVGGGRREHALCPVCYSSDRERLVYLYLRSQTDLFSRPQRLLHVAPERHLRAALLAAGAVRYVSADLEAASVMLRMDIVRTPFCDGTFDTVVCNHVLEHVPDDRAAMAEIRRLLKPGGWALMQVPIGLALERTVEDPRVRAPEAREATFGQRDHVRIYAQDYRDRLEDAGFLVQVNPFVRELEGGAARYGLDARENLYICSRPG